MKRSAFLFIAMLFMACGIFDGVAATRQDSIRESVSRLVVTYPKAHLTDIYKSAFQDRFGPGHLITDTVAALDYLKSEILGEIRPGYADYEPTLYEGHFYRVNIDLVKNGVIPNDVFVSSFLESCGKVKGEPLEQWISDWSEILSVIESMDLDLPDFEVERQAIGNALKEGRYAWHHSEDYVKEYDPHYRIIDRGIFEDRLLPYINDNYWPCGQRKK